MKFFVVVVLIFAISEKGFCDTYTVDQDVTDTIRFSFNVYRSLFNEKSNTVFSPYSFRVLLSILYQSAFGTTAAELEKTLFVHDKTSSYVAQKENLNRIFCNSSVLKLANKIYLEQGNSLATTFNDIVKGYRSEIEQVDFRKAVDVSNNINEWVESKTNGLIKNLVDSSSVTPETALFLVNTLYFKAGWEIPYSAKSVLDFDFNNIDGTKKSIPFISDVGSYKVARCDEYKVSVLEIPYEKDSNFVFWMILPKGDSSINDLKEHLNYEFIQKVNKKFSNGHVDLLFPVFEIESSINGKSLLSNLGLSSLFNKNELNMLNGGSALKVDDILQKTKIIVNTDGTEAATSTFAKIVPIALFPQFRVDRPFVYAVLTADKYEPVFLGHYAVAV